MHPDAIGVIGAGAMGGAVARRLLDRGFPVCVRDVRPEAEAPLREAGARVCEGPAAVARACRIVITLVVDAAQTEDVLFGPEGVARAVAEGRSPDVFVMSTLPPDYVASAAERLGRIGVSLVDAPCSGGPARARCGEMSTMIAAPVDVTDRCADVLDAISSRRFFAGERVGDGSRVKIVNNLLAGANLAAAAEAMDLGRRLGLDLERLFEVVRASSGASWIFEDRMARALANDAHPNARLDILRKDLRLAVDAASSVGSPGFMARRASEVFDAASASGLGDADDSSLLGWYARAARPRDGS
ncbi:MAG: NAD-binding protein [Betaproteobacteria bacterium]|nr:NAD-binding protein [Betaproteobacteria bacterium]